MVRTRPAASANVGSPVRSARSATALTNMPMTGSVSGSSRPAMGVPTTTSYWPDQRASTVANAVSMTVNSVEFRSLARRSIPADTSGENAPSCISPR